MTPTVDAATGDANRRVHEPKRRRWFLRRGAWALTEHHSLNPTPTAKTVTEDQPIICRLDFEAENPSILPVPWHAIYPAAHVPPSMYPHRQLQMHVTW